MTDMELLELAAKAIGIYNVDFLAWGNGKGVVNLYHDDGYGVHEIWNPLAHDGDAFRLAVDVGIWYGPHTDAKMSEYCCAYVNHQNHKGFHRVYEEYENDKHAATRRAIVRVAAEIGRQQNVL